MRRILLCVTLLMAAHTAHAQGVGINTTGAAADTSAILDVSSTAKGFLPPRLTAAQRLAIVLPAKGLVVFQTDGAPGLYYNTGTPVTPAWKLVADAGSLANSGPWQTAGSAIYFIDGPVGIGTEDPTHPLTVVGTEHGLRVQTENPGGTMASFGGYGTVEVDMPGVIGGRLMLAENGNLGLGVTNPTAKLSFAPALGKKISLYPGATGDVGFGVAANRLQIYSDNPNADVAIGYDAAGTFNERFAVKPNGALAVNGNTGGAGQVLQSNGSGAAATWVGAGAMTYANTHVATTNGYTRRAVFFPPAPLSGLSVTFTAPSPARALVMICVHAKFDTPDSIPFKAGVTLMVDGTAASNFDFNSGDATIGGVGVVTHSFTFPLTLTAGSHTVSLMSPTPVSNAPYFTGYCDIGGWDGYTSSLVVQVIPQ